MKKIGCIFLFSALLFAFLGAEQIKPVPLNPTRLGRFDRLKIHDEMKSKGPLHTNVATLQSKEKIAINNAGNYDIADIQTMQVHFDQATLTTPLYEQSGGQAEFENGIVGHLTHAQDTVPMHLKAKTLQMARQTLILTGYEDGESGEDFDSQELIGLKLGPNDIPIPQQDCASLQWVTLTSGDGQQHQVLGLVGCPEIPTCANAEYAAQHPELCCKSAGFDWVNGQCLRTCTGYTATEKIETCGGPSCRTFYTGMTQTDGSCFEDADSFWGNDYGSLLAKTGNKICNTPESYNATSYPSTLIAPLGLTCQQQFGYSADGKAQSCGFYSTSTGPWPTQAGPFCVVGILSCSYTQKTWQCPSQQSCGQEVNSCQ